MTDAELSARMRDNIIVFKRLQASQARLHGFSAPGVHAFALPRHPGGLHQQQVLYTDLGGLEAALGALEDFYRRLAIPAWRVGVSEHDAEAPRLLAAAGYQPGGAIPVMGMEPREVELTPPSRPLECPGDMDSLVALNVEVYGASMDYLAGWNPHESGGAYVQEVREEGRTLATGFSMYEGDTAGIYLVATSPSARRRGLASEVMKGLLWNAHARGCAAAVLQSTELGHGVYRRLGFRDVDRWTNWVRRPSP